MFRNHTWHSTAPFWQDKKKRIQRKKFNFRSLHSNVADGAGNKTLLDHLNTFKDVSAWRLPAFNVHHVSVKHVFKYKNWEQLQVGSYECGTKPGLEVSRIHLYTEDHRHPAVYRGESPGVLLTAAS